MPFCDANLSTEARVEDMVQRLTLAEKIGLMSTGDGIDGSGNVALPSLGLPFHRFPHCGL